MADTAHDASRKAATPPPATAPIASRDPFGEIDTVPLSKIQRLTGAFLARSWSSIPHVTHQDEADVSWIEALRLRMRAEHPASRASLLSFVVKAVAVALGEFPQFNASLSPDGETLVLKKYVHIGVAVDTPAGLLVPVVRDCDRLDVEEIAAEIAAVSVRAREKGLPMAAMQGGCFTISSLGAKGGTGFTPIINAPEVAILGISRVVERPVRGAANGVDWRLTLPLSLSYDHRVINGAQAASFVTRLRKLLASSESLAGHTHSRQDQSRG